MLDKRSGFVIKSFQLYIYALAQQRENVEQTQNLKHGHGYVVSKGYGMDEGADIFYSVMIFL